MQEDLPPFDKGEIIIAHKSEIQLYFKNEKEAKSFEYNKFTENNKNSFGEINAHCGIRGEARALYYDVLYLFN